MIERLLYFSISLLLTTHLFSQTSNNMTLVGTWNGSTSTCVYNETVCYNEVWGYVDGAGNEYGIICSPEEVHFIDLSTPSNPTLKQTFTGTARSIWRDAKSYGNYVYVVHDNNQTNNSEGLWIFDMSALPGGNIADLGTLETHFNRAHNIFIDEPNARLYVAGSDTESSGLIVYSLANPAAPSLLASVDLSQNMGGYVHDLFVRNNIAYVNSGSGGSGTGGMFAIDFNNPSNPTYLADVNTGGYNHSSWMTEDNNYIVYAAETSGVPLNLVDVSDVNNGNIYTVSVMYEPLLGQNSNPGNMAHNPLIHGNYCYVSYYEDGVQVWDISDPNNPFLAGYYDMINNTSYSGTSGVWGVYPFLPSGLVLASDETTGLYVLQFTPPLCEAGTITSSSPQDVCDGASGLLETDGTESASGGFKLYFDNTGTGGTGANGSPFEMDVTSFPFSFDNDLNGFLSGNGWAVLSGTWSVTLRAYDGNSSICDSSNTVSYNFLSIGDPACPSCSDGTQNGNETGVDCGGPDCPACPTCSDGIQNQGETDIDCGGPNCPACPTCSDGIQNGDETGIDCGGSNCLACITCDDGIQNQGETGIDCGGPNCPTCPTCSDGIQNGDETGIDCGGTNCPACVCSDITVTIVVDNYGSEVTWVINDDNGNTVLSGGPYSDGTNGTVHTENACLNHACYDFIIYDSFGDGLCCQEGNGSYTITEDATGTILGSGGQYTTQDIRNFCVPTPTCSDGIQNQDETGIDCGGSICPACPTCSDGVQNGDETGVDCGGTNCPACETCSDGIQNQDETGIDCGGSICPACPSNNDLYVDDTATGTNDGSSWANAFTDLQDALAIGEGKTIHIAEGTYKPTSGTQRGIFFDFPSDCTILGGYPNGGSANRDPETHGVYLNGDVDGDGTPAGNSYHVVRLGNVSNVVADGITIQNGNADNASSFARSRGGGVYSSGSSSTFINVRFNWNKAIYGGAVFATLSNSITFENCELSNNTANYGSALYHSNQTNMYIKSTRVIDNTALVRCSMEANNSLYTKIENSVFANNASSLSNGLAFIATTRDANADIYNTTILGESNNRYLLTAQVGFGDQLDINIYNSIIAHQDPSFTKAFLAHNNNIFNLSTYNCYIQGSSVMGNTNNNLYEDTAGPLQLNPDYSLDPCSPGIDAGNNVWASSLTVDIDGNNRFFNSVDMGAYEAQTSCGSARKKEMDIQIYPNPTTGLLNIRTQEENLSYQIMDILGSSLLRTQETEIDLGQLPAGIYLLRIEQGGEIISTEKIIKK